MKGRVTYQERQHDLQFGDCRRGQTSAGTEFRLAKVPSNKLDALVSGAAIESTAIFVAHVLHGVGLLFEHGGREVSDSRF